nr:WbqC family protein [Luteimonas sp. MC1825]
MQPYFFPYIGYFQLMKAVDCFVFYDDAQYMKGGWVNRNRILHDGAPAWWTHPVERNDYRLPIRERRYARSAARTSALVAKLDGAYRAAPFFGPIVAMAVDYLESGPDTVSSFNQAHLEGIARGLGIDCAFVPSSQLDYDRELDAQSRVIDLCRRLGASTYLNATGGSGLYDADAFARAGLELGFVHPRVTSYPQLGRPHVPFLSIIDVLMFNSPEQATAMLGGYDVVRPAP